jgi:hypothetical protein
MPFLRREMGAETVPTIAGGYSSSCGAPVARRKRPMWEQYKKTLKGMQIIIAAITAGIFVWSHLWTVAAMFFVTMQFAAVVGAMWGQRLKEKVDRAALLSARRG